MAIDLQPIKSAVNGVLIGKDITPQISSSGSQLTIVLNRQHGQSAEYETLSQRIMESLRKVDIPGLDLIKFYGREKGRQPEWHVKTKLSGATVDASATQVEEQSHGGLVALSWLIFVIGLMMMGIGLSYDTAPRGTHNIGLISAKETYTNTGGYLTVSGAILAHHFSSKRSRRG
jgi:hypothetical protein